MEMKITIPLNTVTDATKTGRSHFYKFGDPVKFIFRLRVKETSPYGKYTPATNELKNATDSTIPWLRSNLTLVKC